MGGAGGGVGGGGGAVKTVAEASGGLDSACADAAAKRQKVERVEPESEPEPAPPVNVSNPLGLLCAYSDSEDEDGG